MTAVEMAVSMEIFAGSLMASGDSGFGHFGTATVEPVGFNGDIHY